MFGLPLRQPRRSLIQQVYSSAATSFSQPTVQAAGEPAAPLAETTESAPADPTATDQEPPDPEHERLVNLARAGNAEAFGQIYDRYVDTVFHYLYYRTRDRGLAEDLTSETFLRAWRRIDTFVWQGRDIGAWLVRIARNIMLDHLKSSRYRLEIATSDLIEPSTAGHPTTEETVVSSALAAELLGHIKQLSADQQECLVLRFFEGMSVAETAAVMGKNQGAIKALQHRAVRRLEALVSPELAP